MTRKPQRPPPDNSPPGEKTAALQALIEAMPGAVAETVRSRPRILLYKVMGKVFAILSVRGAEAVGLKCDAHLADILREQYAGVGPYRHYLRNWISVKLDADVAMSDVEGLTAASYALVCAGLSRKQQADLAALAS
jgi:predicted DNA-binding protein (MmcQ/YjbR family)